MSGRPLFASGPLPRAVTVHSLAQAQAALAAAAALARPVLILSPPAAAGYLGVGWFQGLAEAGRAGFPAAGADYCLDCADQAGHALAALRVGLRLLVFTGRGRGAEALAAIAAQEGARLLSARPEALDLLEQSDPRAACRAWLEGS